MNYMKLATRLLILVLLVAALCLPPVSALEEWNSKGLYGLIIDVRNNTANQWILKSGKEYEVLLTYKNNGIKPWSRDKDIVLAPIGKDAKKFRPNPIPIAPGDIIYHGQSYTFHFHIRAPVIHRANANYVLTFRMAQNTTPKMVFGDPAVFNVKVKNHSFIN
jgi:hypothetical protein